MIQVFKFQTGETTCSVNPNIDGCRCVFQGVTRIGTVPICLFFWDEELHEDKGGQLKRLPECLEMFKGESDE